jgi:hypothetical protein
MEQLDLKPFQRQAFYAESWDTRFRPAEVS